MYVAYERWIPRGGGRDERLEKPHLMPLVGADLGWAESRYYSNRVEFVLEDSTSPTPRVGTRTL